MKGSLVKLRAHDVMAMRSRNGRDAPMGKLMGCLLVTTLLLFSAPTENSGKTPVGAELVPAGTPYSPGVLAGGALYVSGLQGTDPETHALPSDFGQEIRNCLENVGHVLKDARMNYSDIVSVQIYLTDMSQFDQVNSIYKSYFASPYPARTTVQVAKLSLGARIEVAAIAHK
jgi:2-iminobutanoate/2-iminopropanoate deaminase